MGRGTEGQTNERTNDELTILRVPDMKKIGEMVRSQ